jgi:hypothetical protein
VVAFLCQESPLPSKQQQQSTQSIGEKKKALIVRLKKTSNFNNIVNVYYLKLKNI